MDFSAAQDQARRTTKKLVLLFLMSVFSLILITNILVAVTLLAVDSSGSRSTDYYSDNAYSEDGAVASNNKISQLIHYLSMRRFLLISLAVSGVVGCAIVYKWVQLSGGGKRVAEQLGGHRIHPNTNDADEKKVLNVVEEMAIASGMPVPAVYLLANESGINAFAAGNTPADAVIGVTRGAVDQFDRDQLQGVIAHEFSHILNGDMRINIRLIAILHGIVFIGLVGEVLMRGGSRRAYISSNRRSNGNQLALLGMGLFAVGWLGRFFGNWIKSAVSRQREYLADASAVQFTRNPQGLADALKIIGGYTYGAQVSSTQASEMRHLFFGQVISKLGSFFATHPPLEQRISLIQPSWDGKYIVQQAKRGETQQAEDDEAKRAEQDNKKRDVALAAVLAGATVATAQANGQSLEGIRDSIEKIPVKIQDQIHEPFGAMAIVYCLLLSKDTDVRKRQIEGIEFSNVKGLLNVCLQLQDEVASLLRAQQFPVVELSLPALKCLSAEQYKVFRKTLLLLVRADRKLDLYEWCVYKVLRHYLDPEFAKVKPSRPLYKEAKQVSSEYQIVLSTLFHFSQQSGGDVDPCTNSADASRDKRSFTRALNTMGLYTLELLDKKDCTLDQFTQAVDTLANCYPLLKPRILKSLSDCAKHDEFIDPVEREMLSAIAAVMDCPLPAL